MPELSYPLAKSQSVAEPSETALTIGSKVTIIGSIQFDGPIRIDGLVQGEVRCDSVDVTRYGTVEGLIIADNVTVAGGVNGSIYANKLVLKKASDVEGEIFHRELSLEDGSYFEGKSRPDERPLELASARKEREHKPPRIPLRIAR